MAAEQKPHRAVEVLEIEDEEQRQERMREFAFSYPSIMAP